MKRIYLVILVLLCGGVLSAQSVHFTYDDGGNRIRRQSDTGNDCLSPRNPENPSGASAGLDYRYFETAASNDWCATSSLSGQTPVKTGSVSNFVFDPRNRNEHFGFEYTGYLDVPTEGSYTIYLKSDDAAVFMVGTQTVVSYEGCHGMEPEQSGTICLKAGKHAIKVLMTQGGGGYGLELRWSGPGVSKALIPNNRLFRTGCTAPAAPTISPTSGTVCAASSQTTTLTASGCSGTKTWYRNGAEVASGGGNTYTASEPGTYTVTCTVEGCTSAPSLDAVVTVAPGCGGGGGSSDCYTLSFRGENPKYVSNHNGLVKVKVADNSDSQVWKKEDAGGGYFKLVSQGSTNGTAIGHALGSRGGGGSEDTPIDLQTSTSGDHQLWSMTALTGESSGWYKIERKGTAYRMSSVRNWGQGELSDGESDLAIVSDPTDLFGWNKWVLTPKTCPGSTCTPPAAPTISPTSGTVCATTSQTVTLTASGCSGTKTWYRNGTQVASGGGNTYTATEPGTYTVTCTENGCTSAPSSGVAITQASGCSPGPGGETCIPLGDQCSGNSSEVKSYTLNAPSAGSQPFTLTYRTNDSSFGVQMRINGGSWTNLTLAASPSGQYATASIGSYSLNSGSNTIDFRSNSGYNCFRELCVGSACTPPSAPGISPTSGTVCVAGSQTVTLTASGCSGTKTWYRNGTQVASGGGNTYTVTEPGTYTVTCTENGCTSVHSSGSVITESSGCSACRTPENPSGTVSGLDYRYFETAAGNDWCATSSLNGQTPVKTGSVSNFVFDPRNRNENFGFEYTGYLDVPTEGSYTIYLKSDDAAVFRVGTQTVVSYEGCHGMEPEQSGTICLKAGKHAIKVLMTQGGGGYGLELRWSGPGVSKALIPNNRLFRTGCTAPSAPGISPTSGTVCVASSQTVTLTASGCSGTKTWYRNGTQVASGGGNTYTATEPGTYTVTCTVDGCTSAHSSNSVITESSGCSSCRTAENPSGTVSGLDYRYFETAAGNDWCATSSLNGQTPVKTGSVSNFVFDPRNRNENFGFEYTGYLDVPTEGSYTIYLKSDDAAVFMVGTQTVVSYEGCHGMDPEQSGTICLKAGKHAIKVLMTQGIGGYGLELRWSGPGVSKALIPNSRLFRTGCAAPPTPGISPSSGTVCAATSQTVLLTASGCSGTKTWYRNGTQVASGGGNTYTATEPGIYTVTCTVDGCTSVPSSGAVITEASGCGGSSGDCYTLSFRGENPKYVSNHNGLVKVKVADNSDSQIWKREDAGGGYFKLVSQGSTNGTAIGHVLGTRGGGGSENTPIDLQTSTSGDHQLWSMTALTGGDAGWNKIERKGTAYRMSSVRNWGQGELSDGESDLAIVSDPTDLFGWSKWVLTPKTCPTNGARLVGAGYSGENMMIEKDERLTVSPNPSSGSFVASFFVFDDAPAVLSIVDMNGRTWLERRIAGRGAYNEVVQMPREASGVFMVLLRTSGGTQAKKVILAR